MKVIIMYRTAKLVEERKLSRHENLIDMFNEGDHVVDEIDKKNTYSIFEI